MTRAEILKEFFKKTVLTVVIAYLLFTWGKILFLKDRQIEYFYVAIFCGIPFGIQRMFLWLIPSGRSSIFLYHWNYRRKLHCRRNDRNCCSCVETACSRMVCPADNLPSADSVKRRIGLSIRLMRICEEA